MGFFLFPSLLCCLLCSSGRVNPVQAQSPAMPCHQPWHKKRSCVQAVPDRDGKVIGQVLQRAQVQPGRLFCCSHAQEVMLAKLTWPCRAGFTCGMHGVNPLCGAHRGIAMETVVGCEGSWSGFLGRFL